MVGWLISRNHAARLESGEIATMEECGAESQNLVVSVRSMHVPSPISRFGDDPGILHHPCTGSYEYRRSGP